MVQPTYSILGPWEELKGGTQACLVVLRDPRVPQSEWSVLNPTKAKETSHCQRFGVEAVDEHGDHLRPCPVG